ncbi:MAG: hypothetical protein H0Z24_09150 [Thermosipho sp. (in: Bacteria)]|nr:hypothetical protein [Thermosipho sp. (in: thermotogales)]
MFFGYLHTILTLIFIFLIILLSTIIYIRFGFRLRTQFAWVILSLFSSLFAVISSYLNFKIQWLYVYNVLQPGTLATILSGIAALGAIAQTAKNPCVYTTLDPKLGTDIFGITLPPNSSQKLYLNVYNCSNITANGVVIQAILPPPLRVISITSPVWTSIDNNGRKIEIHFDTDRSYNPMHPLMHTKIPIQLQIDNDKGSICPIIIYTLAKNQSQIGHTNFIVIEPKKLEDLRDKDVRKSIKRKILPLARIRENYFLKQKIITLGLIILGILPWFSIYI